MFKNFLKNKKSMTLIAGILLIISVAFLAVYFLTGVFAVNEGGADAGNLTLTIWNNTPYNNSAAAQTITINEGIAYVFNLSVKMLNTTTNISSINVTVYGNGASFNLSTAGTTANGTNATGLMRNATDALGRFYLVYENVTASPNDVLIKGGTSKQIWFTFIADRPGSYNMTIRWNMTNTTGGADNYTDGGDGNGEDILDYAYNHTNITIVVNDTTAPTADVFLDLMGADSNTHIMLANATPWVNATKSVNLSCNFTDNYNITQVQMFVIPAGPTFGVAGAPFIVNLTAAKFGFNATALNINNTGLAGVDTSANSTNYSIPRDTNLTTGKYLYYCQVSDNASNKANSTMEPFEIKAWDFGGSVQNSTYNNESGTNVSLWTMYQQSNGPPFFRIVKSVNSSATLGAFNFTEIPGNQSAPTGSVGAGNYSGTYQVKLRFYNDTYKETATMLQEENVTEVGPSLPAMPIAALRNMMNNSVFYTKPAVAFRLCAFNVSNGTASNRSFNYELTDEAIGYPVSISVTAPVSCNTTIAVQQNRSYTISFMRSPRTGAGDGAEWGDNATNGNGSAAPPMSVRFTNLTSYSQGKVIDVIKNLTFSNYNVTLFFNYSGNNTPAVAINNVSVYMASRTGFIVPNGMLTTTLANVVAGAGGWSQFPGRVNWTSIPVSSNNAYNASQNITIAVMGSADGIEYFVVVDGNETLGSLGWMGNFTVTTANLKKNITLERLLGRWDANLTNRTEYMITLINSSGSALTSAQNVELKMKHSNFGITRVVSLGINSTGSFTFPILAGVNYAKVSVFNGDSAPVDWALDLGANSSNVTVSAFRPQLMDPNGNTSNLTSGVTIKFYKSTTACDVPYPESTCLFSSGTATQDVASFNPMQAMIAGKSNVRVNISSGVTMYFIGVDMLASGPPDMTMSQNATNQTVGGDSATSIFKFGGMAPDVFDNVWIGMPYSETITPDSSTFKMSIRNLYNRTWGSVWNYNANTTGQLPDEYSDYNLSFLSFAGVQCSKTNWTNDDCYVNTTDNVLWVRLPHFSGADPTMIGTFAATAASSGSGSGGGSSGASPAKYSWTKITPGAATIAKIYDTTTGIREIEITVKNEVKEVVMTITKQAGQPASITKTLNGEVYKYLNVEKANLTDANIQSALLRIEVEKTWLKSKNLNNAQVAVYRWNEAEQKWTELKTTFTTENAFYSYYDVETPGFSYFAVGQTGGVIETPSTVCGNGVKDSGENCANCPSDVSCPSGQECRAGNCEALTVSETTTQKSYLWIWAIVAVVLILIVILVILSRRK